jgi:hypothetical protein
MNEQKLDEDGEFLVKESISINLIAGGTLLLIFITAMLVANIIWSSYWDALWLFLIPAAFFLARARKNTTIIVINKTGFYYRDKLVTDWKLFFDAAVQQT